MEARDLVKAVSPAGWILPAVAVICAIVAVCLIAGGLGFRWDPFNGSGRKVAAADQRAARAEGQAAAARSDSAARSAEAAGARQTTRMVERAAQERAAVDRIITRNVPPIETPHEQTPAAAGADLRRVYDELCDLRPAVCTAAAEPAASRDAGDGARGLHDPAAAR